jgi:hypothetical protein
MTQDEACQILIDLGGKEYSHRLKGSQVRCFALPPFSGSLVCACNEKPPALHVSVYPEYPGGIECEVFGEAGDGRWLKATIYSVKREELPEILPDLESTARAIWESFVTSLKPRERLSPRLRLSEE